MSYWDEIDLLWGGVLLNVAKFLSVIFVFLTEFWKFFLFAEIFGFF